MTIFKFYSIEELNLTLPESKILDLMQAGNISEDRRSDLERFAKNCLRQQYLARDAFQSMLSRDQIIETLSKLYEIGRKFEKGLKGSFVFRELMEYEKDNVKLHLPNLSTIQEESIDNSTTPEVRRLRQLASLVEQAASARISSIRERTGDISYAVQALRTRLNYHTSRAETADEFKRKHNKYHPEHHIIDKLIWLFWVLELWRPKYITKELLEFTATLYGAIGVGGCTDRNVRSRLSIARTKCFGPQKRGRPSAKNGNAERS